MNVKVVLQIVKSIVFSAFREEGNDECEQLVKECQDILICAAQHPIGIDAIIQQNVVATLCLAVGSFKLGGYYNSLLDY